MKEITIIGGGLAGLALGIGLRNKGVPCVLYEKNDYPRHRVCGEFISGVSKDTLQRLDLLETLSQSSSVPGVRWFIKNRNIFEMNFDADGIGISRYLLDDLLAKLFVSKGGQIVKKKHTLNQPKEGLVQAIGKPLNKGGNWIGLSIHILGTDTSDLEMHNGVGGYVGISPVEDGKANLTGLFLKNPKLKGKGKDLIIGYLRWIGLTHLADNLMNKECLEKSFCAISGFKFGFFKKNNEFSIGDSSQLIPPFVGNGMSMAIESADIASEKIEKYSQGKWHWDQALESAKKEINKLFTKRMMIASALHPLLISRFGLATLNLSSKMNLLPVSTLYRWTR